MDALTRKLRLNRGGVLYFFSLEGGTVGLFTAFLPQIQDHLGLSDDKLGTAVFFFYLGEMVGTPAVAFCLRRFGSKNSTYVGSLLFTALLVSVSFADGFFSLSGIFLAFGIGECLLDVSMNALSILVETVAAYPIIGSFHGSYSVAAAVGGVIGGSLVSAGFVQLHVFSVLFALAFMVSTFFGVAMYSHAEEVFVESEGIMDGGGSSRNSRDAEDRLTGIGISRGSVSLKEVPSRVPSRVTSRSLSDDNNSITNMARSTIHSRDGVRYNSVGKEEGDERDEEINILSMFMIPTTKDMVALAALAFLAAFGESAITTWIIIYTQRSFDLHGDGTLTALTFSLFEVFMGLGRYFVDTLRARLGTKKMVLYAGIFTTVGLSLLVASPSLSEAKGEDSFAFVAACMAAGCTGMGLSTLIPMSYISAGYTEGHAGTSIAIVATWAGAGCLSSPPIVGILSSSSGSIRLAMASLILAMLPLCVLAFFLPPDKYTTVVMTEEDDQSIVSTSGVSSVVTEDLTQPLIV